MLDTVGVRTGRVDGVGGVRMKMDQRAGVGGCGCFGWDGWGEGWVGAGPQDCRTETGWV